MIQEFVQYHDLTERQANIYNWMVEFSAAHHYPPTVRDIAGAFGMRSPNAAQGHLLALEKKRYIRRGGGARQIEFLKIKSAIVRVRAPFVLALNIPQSLKWDEAIEIGNQLITAGEQMRAGAEAKARAGNSEALQERAGANPRDEHTSAGMS